MCKHRPPACLERKRGRMDGMRGKPYVVPPLREEGCPLGNSLCLSGGPRGVLTWHRMSKQPYLRVTYPRELTRHCRASWRVGGSAHPPTELSFLLEVGVAGWWGE